MPWADQALDIDMDLKDVAARAGVGSATVSRVLNGHPGVKSSTRTKVLLAVEQLKYKPNLHARTLAGAQSRVLGIVMANLYNPFFADIYQAIETNARQRGYETLLANSSHDVTMLKASVHRLLGHQWLDWVFFRKWSPPFWRNYAKQRFRLCSSMEAKQVAVLQLWSSTTAKVCECC